MPAECSSLLHQTRLHPPPGTRPSLAMSGLEHPSPGCLCCSNGEQGSLPTGGPGTGPLLGPREPQLRPHVCPVRILQLGGRGTEQTLGTQAPLRPEALMFGHQGGQPGNSNQTAPISAGALASGWPPTAPAGTPSPRAGPAALLARPVALSSPHPILGPCSPGVGGRLSLLFCPAPHLLPPLSVSTDPHPSWPTSPSQRPPMGPMPAPPHSPGPYGTVPPVASEAASFWAQRDKHRKQD